MVISCSVCIDAEADDAYMCPDCQLPMYCSKRCRDLDLTFLGHRNYCYKLHPDGLANRHKDACNDTVRLLTENYLVTMAPDEISDEKRAVMEERHKKVTPEATRVHLEVFEKYHAAIRTFPEATEEAIETITRQGGFTGKEFEKGCAEQRAYAADVAHVTKIEFTVIREILDVIPKVTTFKELKLATTVMDFSRDRVERLIGSPVALDFEAAGVLDPFDDPEYAQCPGLAELAYRVAKIFQEQIGPTREAAAAVGEYMVDVDTEADSDPLRKHPVVSNTSNPGLRQRSGSLSAPRVLQARGGPSVAYARKCYQGCKAMLRNHLGLDDIVIDTFATEGGLYHQTAFHILAPALAWVRHNSPDQSLIDNLAKPDTEDRESIANKMRNAAEATPRPYDLIWAGVVGVISVVGLSLLRFMAAKYLYEQRANFALGSNRDPIVWTCNDMTGAVSAYNTSRGFTDGSSNDANVPAPVVLAEIIASKCFMQLRDLHLGATIPDIIKNYPGTDIDVVKGLFAGMQFVIGASKSAIPNLANPNYVFSTGKNVYGLVAAIIGRKNESYHAPGVLMTLFYSSIPLLSDMYLYEKLLTEEMLYDNFSERGTTNPTLAPGYQATASLMLAFTASLWTGYILNRIAFAVVGSFLGAQFRGSEEGQPGFLDQLANGLSSTREVFGFILKKMLGKYIELPFIDRRRDVTLTQILRRNRDMRVAKPTLIVGGIVAMVGFMVRTSRNLGAFESQIKGRLAAATFEEWVNAGAFGANVGMSLFATNNATKIASSAAIVTSIGAYFGYNGGVGNVINQVATQFNWGAIGYEGAVYVTGLLTLAKNSLTPVATNMVTNKQLTNNTTKYTQYVITAGIFLAMAFNLYLYTQMSTDIKVYLPPG